MQGLQILIRTLSDTTIPGKSGDHAWQYHSRSDRHSKIACWGIVFDLMSHCSLLRKHAENGKVAFGINHRMVDFVHNREKNLDLVICTPAPNEAPGESFQSLVTRWDIRLDDDERVALNALPVWHAAPVGAALVALEAKACMTAHQKARPRLYDELSSSHQAIHGASQQTIAAGFVMVNASRTFYSPDRNKMAGAPSNLSRHKQPADAEGVIAKVRQLPRRSNERDIGFDALAIAVVSMINDGSAASLLTNSPAPASGDIDNYGSFISRLSSIYATRFKEL